MSEQTITWCASCINYLAHHQNFGTCIESRELVDSWCSCEHYKERVSYKL